VSGASVLAGNGSEMLRSSESESEASEAGARLVDRAVNAVIFLFFLAARTTDLTRISLVSASARTLYMDIIRAFRLIQLRASLLITGTTRIR